MLRPAVFLDRDGVLTRPVLRDGTPYAPLRWVDFHLLPGASEAVEALRQAGYPVIVVTNQPEVRRGLLDSALLDQFHEKLREWTAVDDILACPHDERDNCQCRKPRPGMVLEGARRHGIDLAQSYLVGDTERDQGAAQAAGVPFVLIDAPYNRSLETAHRVADLPAAASLILGLAAPPPVLS